LEYHGDRQDVARSEDELLAPVRIEQALAVEADYPADQSSKGSVRCCFDRCEYRTEEFRKIVRS
jgi:hypothetical protein